MTSEGSRLSHLAVWLCVGCAVIVTGLVLRREFTGDGVRIGPRGSIDYQPTPVENWEALVGGGRRVGSDSAIMTIVEFGDFQCPACKQFHERVLSPLMAQHPDEVALVFIIGHCPTIVTPTEPPGWLSVRRTKASFAG
jgi:hypothetical protein